MRRVCCVLVLFALSLSSVGQPATGAALGIPIQSMAYVALQSTMETLPLAWRTQEDDRPRAGDKLRPNVLFTRSSASSMQALDLVGGNFPIATFADQVSGNTDLNAPVVAWNSRRNTYLVVWHAYGRAHGFDIFGREVSDAGATPASYFPIIQTAGTQGNPALTFDAANNQYWLAWEDVSATTNRVFTQRLSTTGQPMGNPVQVSSSGSAAWTPHVACSSQRCVVVYSCGPNDAPWVEARSLDASGNLVGAALHLSEYGAVTDSPDVAYNPSDNQFLAIWSQKQPSTDWDILAQALSPDAVSVGGPIMVYTGARDQSDPRLTYSSFLKRYCAVWSDLRDGNDWDIFGRMLDRSASPLGEAFQIYSGIYNDTQPSVVAHGTRDQFMVVLSHDLAAYGVPAIVAVTLSGAGALGGSIEVRRGDNRRWYPQVAQRTGTDDYLVTCMGDEAGGEPDVFARRVRYDRTLSGGAILVCAGRKGQEWPGVAYNTKNGRYLAAWQDYHSVAAFDIRGRAIAPDGALPGQEVILSQSGHGSFYPVVASLPNRDDVLVAWTAFEDTGIEFRGRRMSTSGQALGSEVLISRDTHTHAGWGIWSAANPTRNEYVVVWSCFTEDSYNIYAQRLSVEGALLESNLPICRANGDQFAPCVVYNAQAKEYLIVWSDLRSPGGGIYGQRLSELGVLVGGEIYLGEAIGTLGTASLAWNAETNEYLLVWRDRVTDSVIYGRRLNAAAQSIGAAFAITQAAWQATYPMLGYDTQCHDYLLTWLEAREGTDTDVVAGHLGTDGVLIGNRFDISARSEIQQAQQLTQNTDNGQFLVIWMDAFAGSWDIFGQRWIGPCLPTPTPPPSPTPTRTLTPTRTPTTTRTPTPTRTWTPFPVRSRLYLPIILRVASQ